MHRAGGMMMYFTKLGVMCKKWNMIRHFVSDIDFMSANLEYNIKYIFYLCLYDN